MKLNKFLNETRSQINETLTDNEFKKGIKKLGKNIKKIQKTTLGTLVKDIEVVLGNMDVVDKIRTKVEKKVIKVKDILDDIENIIGILNVNDKEFQ